MGNNTSRCKDSANERNIKIKTQFLILFSRVPPISWAISWARCAAPPIYRTDNLDTITSRMNID